MKRRELITLAGGAAATASLLRGPFATRAYAAMPTIGYLGNGSPKTDADYVAAFRQGLQETGFVEDRDVAVEYRWAEAAGQHRQSRTIRLAAGPWTDLNRSESTHGFRTIQDRPKDIAAPQTHLTLA
jgi:putative ABC transport system substrate-binding protein